MPDGLIYIITKSGKLFNPNSSRYYKPNQFTKKQKRAYMRLKSGFDLAIAKKQRLTFLTLSTQYEVLKKDGVVIKDSKGKSIPKYPQLRKRRIKNLNYAFTKLKYKIETKLTRLIYEKTCKRKKLSPYYKLDEKHLKVIKYEQIYKNSKFKLKYFKVKTDEGGGVLHIIFRKKYNVPAIPFKWLSHQWHYIWGSPRVNISSIKPRNSQKLTFYMVGQYFSKQPLLRMSYGYSWVYQGFAKNFKKLIEILGYKRALEVWAKNMQTARRVIVGRQTRFRHRKLKVRLKRENDRHYLEGKQAILFPRAGFQQLISTYVAQTL